jgi:serine O-acetyltransferase
MNYRSLKLKFRVAIAKIFIYYLFKFYVIDNAILIKDIQYNFKQRATFKNVSLFKQLHHLLIYYPEFAFLFFWRINSNFFLWKVLFLKQYSCKIFKSTKIKGGIVAYHPFGTVINAKMIGENFIFRNGLTIGNKGNNNSLLPIIGDNVEVGANVVIIGPISIGNNVIIGAGSVVVKDIPENVIVAGNPAKVLKQNCKIN